VSGFAETTKLQPAQDHPQPDRMPTSHKDDQPLVRFWRKRVERRKSLEDFTEHKKYKDEAKKYGKGDLLDDDDIKSWKPTNDDSGVIVQVNMWRRIRGYFVDAVFSANPNLAFAPKEGRSTPETLKNAASVKAMVKHIWDECKQQSEARRALKDGWNGNVSSVKLDIDRARELPRTRWCPYALIVDPECHGDMSRAMWVAEEMRLPAARILQDDTFPEDVRLRLYEKWKGHLQKMDEGGGMEQPRTLYYIYSREGVDPLAQIKALAGEPVDQSERKVLLVVCEGFDEFLLVAPDPCPYLDEDEYPFPTLVLDEEPGEWFGSPQWKMLKGLVDAINWLVSFHCTIMKKKAQTVVLTNKAIWKGGADKLTAAAAMEAFEVDGDPKMAATKLDLGSGDIGQMQGAEMLHEWLARISGFNEVAQGQSTGRKTATEADYLQKNTSLTTKGSNISFDSFLNEMASQIARSALYYIPQFSRVIGPDGMVMTQQVQQVPVEVPPEAAQPGAPPPDPSQPPQVVMQPQAMPVPAPPEEAAQLGAVPFVLEGVDYGLRMPDTEVTTTPEGIGPNGEVIPGVPQFVNPRAGETLRRGVDYFCGPEVAMGWPVQPLEDVKRDLLLTFEAGSTRADFRYDQQQAAVMALNLLGPIYQQTGSLDALYELLVVITQSLPLANTDRMIPPREQFIGGMKAAMASAQAMQEKEIAAKAKGADKGGPPSSGGQA
jgi:hypothetical protein